MIWTILKSVITAKRKTKKNSIFSVILGDEEKDPAVKIFKSMGCACLLPGCFYAILIFLGLITIIAAGDGIIDKITGIFK